MNLFSLYFIGRATSAPDGSSPPRLWSGSLEAIIGSKNSSIFIPSIWLVCRDVCIPKVWRHWYDHLLQWFDQRLTIAPGQHGNFLKFPPVSGLDTSAFHATSQPTFLPAEAILRRNHFTSIVYKFFPPPPPLLPLPWARSLSHLPALRYCMPIKWVAHQSRIANKGEGIMP
jgi:hypothetical protein